MKRQFQRVALIGKYQAAQVDAARLLLQDVAAFVVSLGCEVHVEQDTATHLGLADLPMLDVAGIGAQCDVALVVGGDGTMLGIGRQLARYDVPLIGINQGRLGFVTDIALKDYRASLPPMLAGAYDEDTRGLLHAEVWRGGERVFDALAMNDVVVYRGAASGMVELRVEVDGRFVANHRADGLIVATSTGSTAYALSAGGPLLHPRVAGWVLAPIAPHMLSNRPIVLSDRSEVTLEVVAGRDASASFDMQSLAALEHGDRIIVRRATHEVRFLHPVGWSYFDTLRHKLHWNEGNS
ncbi:MAG: NAD kinase [Paracidovorax wautersii]|uniref:NAD kinase n=1 Tax=Paracidovorax wautersii TaxID=1177982 RepID=A0A7V8FKY3_9BURK|nr:MAG: NAD kinase [Paracidovorax wautersii]